MFDWQTYDPLVAWKNRPGYSDRHLEINELGFKGPSLAKAKPAGVTRIVCLGDSSTFGIWQESPPSGFRFCGYPEELSRLLEANGTARTEVVNAGVVGYTSAHGLRQLMTQILDLEPDIVTVRFGFNDHSMSWEPALRAGEPSSPAARRLLYRFGQWRLARLSLAIRLFVTMAWERAAFWRSSEVRWVSRERFEANLGRFAEIARQRGFKLLFIDYPLRSLERGESTGVEPPYPLLGVENLEELHELHDAYQAVVERVAAGTGVPLLRTRELFEGHQEEVFSDHDMVHPNSRGARVTAQALLRRFEEESWIGGDSAGLRSRASAR